MTIEKRFSFQEEASLLRAAKILAVLSLQSDRYGEDMDFRDAVDDVLLLTKEVSL